VQNEHVWPVAWADNHYRRDDAGGAAEKAFKRVDEILARYPIADN
jgi:hypothetical protein